ncbi:MAG: hydroxypyruvate isomerase [Verrucomicrobiales bacterium]|jgi:hydroxypyruvate isomerase
MLKPSVCIDAVFEGESVASAIKTVAQAGLPAIEFWGWWDRDLEVIQTARAENGLALSACCTKFISLVDPALRNDYIAGLAASIEAAGALGTKTLISQVGDFRVGVSRAEQHQSLLDGLKAAAPLLEQSGITLVIEPLNELVDHAGYYLVRSDEAFELVDEVGSPNVKVVYDIYHQQISEGHLIHTITTHIDRIGHFHAAGNPGRHELTRGEIHYPQVFQAIRETDYEGYVGLEYWPVDDPLAGLQEVASWFA